MLGRRETGGASLPFIIPRSPPAAKFSRTVFSSERERGMGKNNLVNYILCAQAHTLDSLLTKTPFNSTSLRHQGYSNRGIPDNGVCVHNPEIADFPLHPPSALKSNLFGPSGHQYIKTGLAKHLIISWNMGCGQRRFEFSLRIIHFFLAQVDPRRGDFKNPPRRRRPSITLEEEKNLGNPSILFWVVLGQIFWQPSADKRKTVSKFFYLFLRLFRPWLFLFLFCDVGWLISLLSP